MKPKFIQSGRAHKAILRVLLLAVCGVLYVNSQLYGQIVTKQLYLGDPSQVLDRIDPVATADATLAQTAGLTTTSKYLYVLRGASRTDFWRYDIAAGSWAAMASTPGVMSSGGAMATDGTDIYALRGSSNQFWKYTTLLNLWAPMSTTPSNVGAGGAMVHINGVLYALRGGGTNTFWKYTILTNVWTPVANTPGNVGWGGALTTDGTNIYALQGGATNVFWKYTIATNTWSVLATLPATITGGGSLSFDGTAIYALRGGSFNNFYKYTIASNTWSSLTNTSSPVSLGGSLVSDDPITYALRGNSANNFWSFNGSSWTSLNNTPSNVDSGAAIIKMGAVPKTVTFTQTPTLCSPLTIKGLNTITVRTYVSSVYGTIPVNPAVTATLRYGSTTIITLTNPVYSSATNLITWTGTLLTDVTIPIGQAIALDIRTSMQGVSFKIDYDHQNKPSRIDLPVSTFIKVNSVAVYDAAYPGGTQVSTVLEGATRYIRTTVTDPFGFADIRGADITITPPGTTTAGTSVYNMGCTRIYQNTWAIPIGTATYNVSARAKEGYENTVTHTNAINIATCINCPPTAYDDAAIGFSGEPLDVDVLSNDSDPNGNIDSASLTIISNPKNGDAIIDNNKITYLPNGTFSGNDTLTYQICDRTAPVPLCATAKMVVTITPNTFNTCDEVNKGKIYYMPYAETEAQVALVKSASVALSSTNIRTIISIKVTYPGIRLVWDNWEDGYEADILNPVQGSTEIWGDGNIYNGFAPGYPTDVIPPGGNIVLDNTMATPRNASSIFYDGRDKLFASNQVAVTQVCGEPNDMAVQCMKTNVSAYPSEFGELFYMPVGENLPSQDFRYTALFIRAADDNTYIQIDRDADGDFETNFVLNEGQVMRVDNATAPAGVQMKAGAVITADKPIGVDAHFGGVDNFSSREIPLYPSSWYSHTYYTPVPTTGPGTGIADTAVVMFYNSLSRNITINWSSGAPASGSFVLGANSSYRFPLAMSATAAYKFVNPTKESFVAMEIVDSYTPGGGGNAGDTRDWAFNLISEARLTDFGSIAWAPGSTNGTRNDNPIWVTPTANTTIYVKYDGDVVNGPLTSPCGLKYDISYTLNALNYLKIKDNADNDQSGTAVYTCDGAKIALVYGEDPATAQTANPSWDVGSTIQPFCKEKKVLANTDYAITLVNTPVTIGVLNNDRGFLAIIDPATINTNGFPQATNGVVTINPDGTLIYTPNPGFAGVDSFVYNVCSTPFPVVCGSAVVYVTINACPSPTGMNVITGQVFLDKNEDGTNNDGGTGFHPAKIYLYTDGNCNNAINTNELIDSVNVDINGYYQFVKSPEKIVSDNFDLVGGGNSCATGSDGTMPWNNNWLDAGDAAAGFCVTPVPVDNDVEIMQDSIFGNALRLDDANMSAVREFNMQFATKAFLSFSYRKATTSLTNNESVAVQLSSDGITYNTVYTIAGNGTFNSNYISVPNIKINTGLYNTSNRTFIRFLTSSRVDEGDFVFIDNITIRFTQYDQCYIVGLKTSALPTNSILTTAPIQSFTFNTSGTCQNSIDFGILRISTYAVNDENSTWKDMNVSGEVKLNDFDQEDNTQNFGSFLNPLTKAIIASGTPVSGFDKTGATVANAGTITFNATGNYTFDPSPNFTGTVTIPYKICDNASTTACDTAYLSITVDPLPATANSVIANNDEDISYGTAITGNLLVNDRDPKNYSFTITLFRYDSNGDGITDITTLPGSATVAGVDIYGNAVTNAGILSVNPSGTYTFTPAAGFTGSIDASYTITNTAGASSVASIHFEILDNINGIQNDPPFAGDDFGYTTVNKPVSGSFISNDKDYNQDTLSLNGTTINTAIAASAIGTPVATAQGGTVQFYSDGTYTYTPPTGYIGPDIVYYTICDVTTVAPQPLCANATLHLLVGPGISISGKVWDDGNGNVIPQMSFENVTNANGTLYINLVDALGYVIATAAVANDGTYSFSDVPPGNSYSLVLSTINGIIGTPAPSASLPSGWTNTGETRNGTIDNGSAGVIDNRTFGFTNTINFDFGIEQLPTSVPFYVNIDQPTVGQKLTLNGGSNPPVLSGKDAEDCAAGCTLDARNVVIDVVPNNADLFYNGVLVTAGQLIINFNPDLLQIQFTSATLGSKTTEFYYSFVDSAGKKDPATAVYSLNWLTLLPVKGLELTALKAGKNVMLNWKTITEMNSDHFEIERSTDGRNYVKVGMNIAAAGNSEGEKQYQLSDDVSGLSSPVVYYRVKLLDTKGKYAYSNVSTVKLPENGALIKVVPNPFISELTVSVSVEKSGSFGIRMLDMGGRTISSNTQKISKETPLVTLRNLNNLTRGIYLIEITDVETGKKTVFKVEKAY